MKRLGLFILLLITTPLLTCVQKPKLEVHVEYYSPYPLAFFNAYYVQRIPDISYHLTNPNPYPVRVRILSEYVGYSHEAVTTIQLQPKSSVIVNQTIPLILDKIREIREETYMPLHYTVQILVGDRWLNWSENTFMVRVYPIDCMVWAVRFRGTLINTQDYIAVFVTPNSPAIDELISKAKRYTPDHELRGADGKSLPQVYAIFAALKYDYKLKYVNTPYFYGRDYVQRIRLPSESLRLGEINCVDGAVLFASALESLGFRTYIALLPDHAFVAWIDPKEKKMFALETTYLNSSFAEALNEGLRELNANWKNLTDSNPWNGYLVDIEACRKVGIVPLPFG